MEATFLNKACETVPEGGFTSNNDSEGPFMCVHLDGVRVCVCARALVHRSESALLGVFLYCSLPCILRQSLSVNVKLTVSVGTAGG